MQRPGGSDVSQVETVATETEEPGQLGPHYLIDGFKWFSSATDSDVAVALARTGPPEQGSRSLSLFIIPLRFPLLPGLTSSPSATSGGSPSTSNNVFVHRLKNKIGTHALPTAELSLQDSHAYLLGDLNKGVKCIAPVLNITRVWSGVTSAAYLRRCLAIATGYACVRVVNTPEGKRLLKEIPVHVAQLARVGLVYRALTHLAFDVVRLLGRAECSVQGKGASGADIKRLRMMTPTLKAFASELAVGAMEETMACLGGQGYMEENAIGRWVTILLSVI